MEGGGEAIGNDGVEGEVALGLSCRTSSWMGNAGEVPEAGGRQKSMPQSSRSTPLRLDVIWFVL
jgi:hypothetical protein